METEPAFTQLVTQVLQKSDHPLTLDEIMERAARIRPVRTNNPRNTIRGAIQNVTLAASLGGRPAHYTWLPHHLAGNAFRQPLTASDLESGNLVMTEEVWLALWPDFYAGSSRSPGDVTLILADGREFQTRIQHLVTGQPVWGLPATPELARWYQQQGATPEDELIVSVVDAEARRYAVTLVRRADRDEPAIATRNQALADVIEDVLRAAPTSLMYSHLISRLVARDVYRSPLPPDLLDDVLRTDLRFIGGRYDVTLAEKLVDWLERDQDVPPDPWASPRPRGDRRKARTDKARQAWGAYLFDRGMDHLWAGLPVAAEAYSREAVRLDPGHADAWVHLGNRRFDGGQVAEALRLYEQGQAAAQARTIGDPAQYPSVFWGDVHSRPFMRALHGKGLCLWRLGRVDEARQVFAWMLKLNPNDNQGARFVLQDLDEDLSWEESSAQEEERIRRLEGLSKRNRDGHP